MIAGMTYYQIAWYFLIYSFFGWCIEVVYQAVKRGKVINRGFLCGPVCPVYGFGALAIFALTKSHILENISISENDISGEPKLMGVLVVFVFGVIFATLIELVAGWLLYTLFHARWWDYSKEPLNFHGFICLRFSIIWGLVIVLFVCLLQPIMENSSFFRIPERIGWPIAAVLYVMFAIDLVITVLIVTGMNKKLEELNSMQENMRSVSNALSEEIGETAINVQQAVAHQEVQSTLAFYELRDRIEEKKKEFLRSNPVFGSKRLFRAFPDMYHRDFQDVIDDLKETFKH